MYKLKQPIGGGKYSDPIDIPDKKTYDELLKEGWKPLTQKSNIVNDTMKNLNINTSLLDLNDLENSSSIYAVGLFIILGLLVKTIGGVFK